MFNLKSIHADYSDRHKIVLTYMKGPRETWKSEVFREGEDYSPEFSKIAPGLVEEALLRLMLDAAIDVHPYANQEDYSGWLSTKLEGDEEDQWRYGLILHTKFLILLKEDFEEALEAVQNDEQRLRAETGQIIQASGNH